METPARPAPPAPRSARWREQLSPWLEWFGPARLVSVAVATVVVVGGGYLLLRPPSLPAESSLPVAAPVAGAPAATLVPPAITAPATAAAPAVEEVTVHVAGAVAAPGVYRLPGGARVADAVEVAGGPVGDADPDALNLAAPIVDGTRIYVPVRGEVAGALVSVAVPAGGSAAAEATGPLDVNVATAEQLDALPGVGPSTAAAIVTERERNGPFAGVDDLDRVPGIGPAKLDALRDLVTT